jgi:radical SAM superfamily enzyme YgiQ (UPF0313 family)
VPKRFSLLLVKPSHYDDDGYVIQWLRSAIPSNSLAALYGLARDCAARRVLGDDVDMDIHAFDETNTRIRPDRLAKMIERSSGGGMVMLVGVQSNQFPRALDIARPLRARGITVALGGFHVSGTVSMLGGVDAGLDEARALGISLYAGEAEGRFDTVLQDAYAGALKPFYNFMTDLPALQGTPIPLIPAMRASRTAGGLTSFDAGRGCPFQCSFCTIINVQGRKSRGRSADDVEQVVRENVAQGLNTFFITDDNFARNRDWEAILDRLIELREKEGMKIRFILQVDTLCHKIPRFIEKCQRAGVRRVFIGLENINPESLVGAKKRQNKITEYRKMLLAWKKARVITYAGYILGFPGDTIESIRHDIEIIKKELPVDMLEFFFLTPLPGSEDHQKLVRAGATLDADLNRYDLNHSTAAHPRMSREEWERAYAMAWKTYYTDEHMETVLRRLTAAGSRPGNAVLLLTWFKGSQGIEKVHPLEAGAFRFKFRRDRRPGFPILPVWQFYPQYFAESLAKIARWIRLWARLRWTYGKIKRDKNRLEYMDLALTPVGDDELETHELYAPRERVAS